jgi:phosphatidylglycerophosphatase A
MLKKIYQGLATAGGIGLLPLAPGTWAAIATTITWYFLKTYTSFFYGTNEVIINVFICLIGILASGKVIKEWGKDPSRVVIDEVAGMSISLIMIPVTIRHYVIALILFRIFDIAKPLGIRQAEKAGGGFGIMLDDIFAGIYSLIILNLLIYANIL